MPLPLTVPPQTIEEQIFALMDKIESQFEPIKDEIEDALLLL